MPAINKIYEKRLNEIWDNGDCYRCVHKPSGEAFVFDHTEAALQAMKDGLEESSAIWSSREKRFYFQPAHGQYKKIYIQQSLYAAATGKSLAEVKRGIVWLNDGDTHNLVSSNLSHSRSDDPFNAKRSVWHDAKYIYLNHHKSGRFFYTDFKPELFELLCAWQLCWGYDAGHDVLFAKVIDDNGHVIPQTQILAHQLVWIYHHYGARRNNFLEPYRQMRAEFKQHKSELTRTNRDDLTIDHFDSVKWNDCIRNLSVMTLSQNSRKNDLTDRVQMPYTLVGVVAEDGYRIAAGRMLNHVLLHDGNDPQFGWIRSFQRCPDAESLISFLQEYLDTPILGESPAQYYKLHKDRPGWCRAWANYRIDKLRDALAQRDAEGFEVYTAK